MKARFLLIAIAALAIASCGNKDAEKDAAANAANQTAKVKLSKVSSQEVPQTETYTATVESEVKNNIAPNTPMRIEKIYADVGDQVRKGQLLVQLDASNLIQMKLQIENTQVEFKRIESLYNVGGVSKAEYDNLKTQLDVLSTQYKQLMTNTQLVSPVSGVVTARNYDDGDMYGGQPVLTIEQLNPVKIIAKISEEHYKDVKIGMNVDITLDAYAGEEFVGKVSIISPTVDQVTHTFPVEITIANGTQKVRPGMFARATVNFGTKSHVVIPDEALVKQIGAGDRYVYVYNKAKSTVSYKRVDLGKHIGDKYEILSGVNDGDEIVIAGQARLADGKEVTVEK